MLYKCLFNLTSDLLKYTQEKELLFLIHSMNAMSKYGFGKVAFLATVIQEKLCHI